MQSEIFQDQLWNFSTAYFTSSRYEVASEDMSQFLKDVSETATENDVHIFSQYNEINNKYLSTLHIYGDDKVIRQTLKNTAKIFSMTKRSIVLTVAILLILIKLLFCLY